MWQLQQLRKDYKFNLLLHKLGIGMHDVFYVHKFKFELYQCIKILF